jgi:hypothetical protein
LPRSCLKSWQDLAIFLAKMLPRNCQDFAKILTKILPRSCKNLGKILSRFCQDFRKILSRSWQVLVKILAKKFFFVISWQDLGKILNKFVKILISSNLINFPLILDALVTSAEKTRNTQRHIKLWCMNYLKSQWDGPFARSHYGVHIN